MLGDIVRAYRELFTSRAGRIEVAALLVVMAVVPLAEILAIGLFSDLITDGRQRFTEDPVSLVLPVTVFFLAFALARAAHHAVRFLRVRSFARRFGTGRTPSQESWEWALAFELSGVVIATVQVVTFAVFFAVVDLVTAAVNAVVVTMILAMVSVFYRRERALQVAYVAMGARPGTTPIADRVGGRIRSAEWGSVAGSVGLAVCLGVVLLRAVRADIGPPEAIMLFLGLRIVYGQFGQVSSAAMRFSRAAARRGLVGEG